MTLQRVRDLDFRHFESRLSRGGIGLRIGPFDVRVRARVEGFAHRLWTMYAEFPLLDDQRLYTCHLELSERTAWTTYPQRMVRFTVDGLQPHEDMPVEQAYAVFEWGFNLVIALRLHRFLMLHAAVLERDGGVVVMPAAPGQGKTTLCAALAHRGWRLFSDEFGLLRPEHDDFLPLPRPLPLKNASIDVIRAALPQATLGAPIAGTIKGTVAHLRAPAAAVHRAHEGAPARWIVFPRWQASSALSLEPVPRADAFMHLARNAFNYELVAEPAFDALRRIVDRSQACLRLVYSDLDEAVAAFDRMAADESNASLEGELR